MMDQDVEAAKVQASANAAGLWERVLLTTLSDDSRTDDSAVRDAAARADSALSEAKTRFPIVFDETAAADFASRGARRNLLRGGR
jgi:hypothetical protein